MNDHDDNNSSQRNWRKLRIHQLEVQVDFLKSLRTSECEKRNEAINECQQLKKKIELLETGNSQLIQESKNTQEELLNAKKNLKLAKCDLKKCSDQLGKLDSHLRKRKEEKLDLMSKVTSQEEELLSQNTTISRLEETLKTTEMNLQNSETNLKTKQGEMAEVLQHLQNEVDSNYSMKEEIGFLREAKINLENHSRFLEDQLENYISNCEELNEENLTIKSTLEEVSRELLEEKKKAWYKDTKEIASVSFSVLQNIAKVVLPIYYHY
ncbi:hypothetical protein JTB14_023864 [Gonioctena quinquepunctata]|nr:hypothetical protein JTB14_023864 [Gonioctena quinquepunctata]